MDLQPAYKAFIEECEEIAINDAKKGNNYNIFEELLSVSDEVRHSSFLSGLFNSNGSHGEGSKFLETFINAIGIGKLKLDLSQVKVYCEYSVNRFVDNSTYGRIDILIELENGKRAIVIENKIYAPDQPRQLERYNDFAKSKYGELNKDYWLVYLTLFGTDPSEDSLGSLNQEQIICASYKESIQSIVNQQLDSCNSRVQSILRQYKSLISRLTDGTDEFYRNIVPKSRFKDRITVEEIQKIRDFLRKQFFLDLKSKLDATLDYDVHYVHQIHKKDINIDHFLTDSGHKKNVGIEILVDKNLKVNIEVQQWSRLLVGVFDPRFDSKQMKKFIDQDFEQDDWWLYKELKIKDGGSREQTFYSDYLNYQFLKNSDDIVERTLNEVKNTINLLQ